MSAVSCDNYLIEVDTFRMKSTRFFLFGWLRHKGSISVLNTLNRRCDVSSCAQFFSYSRDALNLTPKYHAADYIVKQESVWHLIGCCLVLKT